MKTISEKVFNGEGFLINNIYGASHEWRSVIAKVNPIKLLNRINNNHLFYDTEMIIKMIHGGIKIEDKEIVFSEWTNKEIKNVQELESFLYNNPDFVYREYKQ